MSRKASTPGKRRPTPGDRQIKFQRLLGLIFCAGGAAAIGVGWYGAARVTCVDCQIPYLLSGGAAGIAGVIFGATMLVMAQLRTEGRRIAARLEQLTAPAGRPARWPARAGVATAPSAAPPDGDSDAGRTAVLAPLAGADAAVDGSDGVSPEGEVVAGPSTYHRPSCRLVQGKEDLERMGVEEARDRGLTPCRVCDPDAVPADAARAESEPSAPLTSSAQDASTDDEPDASAPAATDDAPTAAVPGAAGRPGGFWRSRRRARTGRRGEPQPAPEKEELGI